MVKHCPWHFVSRMTAKREEGATRRFASCDEAEARPGAPALSEPRSGEFAGTARRSEERLACAEQLAPSPQAATRETKCQGQCFTMKRNAREGVSRYGRGGPAGVGFSGSKPVAFFAKIMAGFMTMS